MNKMHNSKNNMNMEDIMRMNDVLKPFQERSKEGNPSNINDICMNVEDNVSSIEDMSTYLKEFEADVNKSVELMTNDLFKFFDDSYNEFNPELLTKYKYLKSKIKDQKDENANLLKQIDLLNQEISQIFESIIKLGSRLDGLEKICGLEKQEIEEEDEEYSDI
jgi:septal ring factor EnvC (AmiA/AmiB activator)